MYQMHGSMYVSECGMIDFGKTTGEGSMSWRALVAWRFLVAESRLGFPFSLFRSSVQHGNHSNQGSLAPALDNPNYPTCLCP